MKTKPLLLILCLLISKFTYSQQSLKGEWILIKRELADPNAHVNPYDRSNYEFIRFIFNKNTLSLDNDLLDHGNEVAYSLTGNKLTFVGRKFEILSKTDSTLKMLEIAQDPATGAAQNKIWYLKEGGYLSSQNLKNRPTPSVFQTDTFSLSDGVLGLTTFTDVGSDFLSDHYFTPPIFDREKGYFGSFMQNGLTRRYKVNVGDLTIVSFNIDIRGGVSDIEIIKSVNEKLDKDLIKRLKATSYLWTAPILNGEKYPIKMVIPIVIGENNERYVKAKEIYEEGNELYYQGKLEAALAKYNQSLALYPQLTDAIYNRAIILFESGQKDKACLDWLTIYKTGSNSTYQALKTYCGFN